MKSKWAPWIFFLLVYSLNFFIAAKSPTFPIEEALGSVIILGVLFSSVAYFLVRKCLPLEEPKPFKQHELLVLGPIFITVSVLLIFGNTILTFWLPASLSTSLAAKEVITLVRKVALFVLMPFFAYRYFFGFTWKDFGFTTNTRNIFTARNVLVFITMALLFTMLQWFGGRAAEPIRAGEFNSTQLILGMPMVFIWLFIEVGLVEEFFFRALLQDRISALAKSTSWSIVIASLLFGLAHAPGMYFREAGVTEGLGANPSVLEAICYCIAVQATAGLPFAIIWSKTRNLWLLMTIHAMADLLSNYAPLMKAFWSS